MELFETNDVIHFDIPDGNVTLIPNFLTRDEAFSLFIKWKEEFAWQKDQITVFGKTYEQPRLTALFGASDKPYTYSNITMYPHPWTNELLDVKTRIEVYCKHKFTTALANLYRNGRDSNGWHADDERELGQNPTIASLSLGETRYFHLKHNTLQDQKLKIPLTNGSLLIMSGVLQHFWKHQIPKTAKPVGSRINLTFRTLV